MDADFFFESLVTKVVNPTFKLFICLNYAYQLQDMISLLAYSRQIIQHHVP